MVLAAAACHGGSAVPVSSSVRHVKPSTVLTIVYRQDTLRAGKFVVVRSRPLRLTCDPASGNLPNPAGACRRIQSDRAGFFGTPSGGCFGGDLRWSVAIHGVLDGRRVSRTYDMCAYPQARAWTDLGGTKHNGIVPGLAAGNTLSKL